MALWEGSGGCPGLFCCPDMPTVAAAVVDVGSTGQVICQFKGSLQASLACFFPACQAGLPVLPAWVRTVCDACLISWSGDEVEHGMVKFSGGY